MLLGSLLSGLRHCDGNNDESTIRIEVVEVLLTFSNGLVGLVDRLDNSDGNSLPHVTDGETTERSILAVRPNALPRNIVMSNVIRRK